MRTEERLLNMADDREVVGHSLKRSRSVDGDLDPRLSNSNEKGGVGEYNHVVKRLKDCSEMDTFELKDSAVTSTAPILNHTEDSELNAQQGKRDFEVDPAHHPPALFDDIVPSEFPGMNDQSPEIYHAGKERHDSGDLDVYINGSSDSNQDLENPGDDDDDNVSEISDISNISGLSGEEEWRSMAGPISWVHRQMSNGRDPRDVLSHLLPHSTVIPPEVDNLTLWKIVVELLSEPPSRKKLGDVNTLDDVVHLIKNSKKIVVLTGAGVSVSCGIPDFRSRDGVYARLAVDYPDLPDPQAMFDIRYFRTDQRPFFKFAKEIYPGQFKPSPCHRFIKLIENNDKLLRNYTQNIDTLEQVAGIKNVIQCHGSFATATCMSCKLKVDSDQVKEDIMNQVIPRCPQCPQDAFMPIMKPDIVFFGESLPEEFHRQMASDKDECDLLIVIGSSLKVRPVALIPNSLPQKVPQILINREPLKHINFDVELLGDCDGIVSELCHRLGEGWTDLAPSHETFTQVTRDQIPTPPTPCSSSIYQSPMSINPISEENSNMSVTQSDSNMSTQCTNSNQRDPVEPRTSESEQVFAHELQERLHEEKHRQESQSQSRCQTPENTASTTAQERVPHSFESEDSDSRMATTTDLESLRAKWVPKRRESIAKRLAVNTFLYLPPNRYVFPGAEVYSDDDRGYDSDEDDEVDEDCHGNSETEQSTGQPTSHSDDSVKYDHETERDYQFNGIEHRECEMNGQKQDLLQPGLLATSSVQDL